MGHDPRPWCCPSVGAASSAAPCSASAERWARRSRCCFIISLTFNVNIHILQNGTSTISALIANDFGESTSTQLAALLTAGLVLFLITLVVNTVAAVFITRSRSGAATEI